MDETMREFPKIRAQGLGSLRNKGLPYVGGGGFLIIRVLLFRVLYQGPLFSATPMSPDVLSSC